MDGKFALDGVHNAARRARGNVTSVVCFRAREQTLEICGTTKSAARLRLRGENCFPLLERSSKVRFNEQNDKPNRFRKSELMCGTGKCKAGEGSGVYRSRVGQGSRGEGRKSRGWPGGQRKVEGKSKT